MKPTTQFLILPKIHILYECQKNITILKTRQYNEKN